MLGVDKIGEIRRAHCREGRSIKGISRPPGVSRATFRKVLWTGATEFVYERRTLMRIFEDLQALGCEGGDDAVRRHASRRAKVREHYGKPESQISTAIAYANTDNVGCIGYSCTAGRYEYARIQLRRFAGS